ncbi:T9SS type A sorting domain-containing protein [Pseudobacter ginsenosidimutans]|uniref:Putative secreted protein (Por secretion system target) n=1 Tax=Pseudobacter ginsenosidimutans TaxID=661488 RepID=A0A4Q7N0J1_9BACT|nr:T9SS type A sorting domain-containing protein [Pseudobacter ginsenosidimutans]QEC43714.1 T9SS type A sorting domain-containing protein [Pseudobacter ginsenosidimutans]RZS75121.1 putative secreted protein (Por secretion system target) [Pseudobacter ginsenosidimutans]
MKRILLFFAFSVITFFTFSQSIVYVDAAAAGANDGSSWPNAYRHLSSALAAANAGNDIDTIFIAKGTYYPTGDQSGTNRDSAFLLLRGNLFLYGGFDPANGITEIGQRNIQPYGGTGTILSGNINNAGDSLDNCWHVMVIATYANDLGKILLDGLTIRDGNGTMAPGGYKYYRSGPGGPYGYYGTGGGMLITSPGTQIRMRNVVVSNNVTQGIHSRRFLDMENCSVVSNIAPGGDENSTTHFAVSGGGLYCLEGLKLKHCLVADNQIYYGFVPRGGGIYLEGNLDMEECIVRNNTVLDAAGCSPLVGEGGGGGIYAHGYALIKNSEITGNAYTVVLGCVWDGEFRRYRYGGGGGLALNSNTEIVNSIIAFNSISGGMVPAGAFKRFAGGGIMMMDNAGVKLVNSIIYGNTDPIGAAISAVDNSFSIPVNIGNSVILSNSSLFSPEITATRYHSLVQGFNSTTDGNLDASAAGTVFTNAAGGDFSLPAGSVLINKGNNNLYNSAAYPDVELNGHNRVSGGVIDIGPFEYGSTPGTALNVLYVDSSVAVSGDGSSWASAFRYLSDALLVANDNIAVDSILVAKGTYYPTGAQNGTDRNRAFFIRYGGLKIFGGFPGGGGSFSQRVLPAATGGYSEGGTILSGDINTGGDSTDNSYHVFVVTDIPQFADSIVIDGFSVHNGNANAPYTANYTYGTQTVFQYAGGGAVLWNVSNDGKLQFRNCNFNNNTANGGGGAIISQNARAGFQQVSFYNNISREDNGGAIYNAQSASELKFKQCRFGFNISRNNYGGAISNHTSAAVVLERAFFLGNMSSRSGGAIYNSAGTRAEVTNGLFYQNRSNTLNSNFGGAAVYVNSSVFIGVNCTFVGQSSGSNMYGFLSGAGGGSVTLSNSIATNNPSGGVAVGSGTAYIQNFSLIQDQNYSTDQNLNYSTTSLTDLYVNINDPDGPDDIWLTADDGLRPTATSPVREEGNTALAPGNSLDISGSPRIRGCNVDLGAYESDATRMVLHVDAVNGNDINSGNSWQAAFKTMKKALDIANASACVDSILVAKGKYYPVGEQLSDMPGYYERHTTFAINRPGIRIYGGFQPGGAGGWPAREMPTDAGTGTILSGDIGANHDSTFNSFWVMVIANVQSVSDSIVIDGIGVTEGFASFNLGNSVNGIPVDGTKGGGATIIQSSVAIGIRNCVFYRNSAIGYGGGLAIMGASPRFTNTRVTSNYTTRGGGMYLVNSNAVFSNCIIAGNQASSFVSGGVTAGGEGGAIYTIGGSPVFVNCNIVTNLAAVRGGVVHLTTSSAVQFRNSILWGNNAPASPAISVLSGTANTSYSIVEGGYTGEGNLNANPMFNNISTGDYTLQNCSPAINAGNNSLVPAEMVSDIAGAARIQLGKVDIGVYESNANEITAGMALGNAEVSNIQSATGLTSYASNCNLLVAQVTGDNSPTSISGNVKVKVWTEFFQPANFVRRHYEITPDNNAATATGRVTLFFTQQDFVQFNNVNAVKLPVTFLDDALKPNLLIEKFAGTSSNGTGLPESYAGRGVTIDPSDVDIVWNSNRSRWEVSFDITGFSGFFVKTQIQTLPLTLISFTGIRESGVSELKWETANENQVAYFELERSAGGNVYSVVTRIPAKNGTSQHYSYYDNYIFTGLMSYRLKMVDIDGTVTYSKIVLLSDKGTTLVSLNPNPAKNRIWIETGDNSLKGSEVVLLNAAGAVQLKFGLQDSRQEIDISMLKTGMYFIRLANDKTIKFVKE